MGTYSGNGSTDGPFVNCNFRPRWVMIKAQDSAESGWMVYDGERLGYNPNNARLRVHTETLKTQASSTSIS